ncbi:MAG: hypothetical protein JWN38_21 [Candidatus Saccharibacteria bacterium]|nr:hypothetical protein [Candidatus Saccharibacteria bacterium]
MASSPSSTLYKEVVSVTETYFGPAADRFVKRQISHHLNKKPEQLQKRDLVVLIDWIGLAMALLIDDEKVISKYVAKLRDLAGVIDKR